MFAPAVMHQPTMAMFANQLFEDQLFNQLVVPLIDVCITQASVIGQPQRNRCERCLHILAVKRLKPLACRASIKSFLVGKYRYKSGWVTPTRFAISRVLPAKPTSEKCSAAADTISRARLRDASRIGFWTRVGDPTKSS